MLQIDNLHATVADKPILKGLLPCIAAALLVAGCSGSEPQDGEAKSGGLGGISVGQVASLLPPAARDVAQSYERDVRAELAAYKAEFGHFPASLTEIPSAAALRATAVSVIADGLGEQVPFASRETVEKAANAFVGAAEQRILNQMKAQDAPNK